LWTSCTATGVGGPVLETINGTQWKSEIAANFKSGNTEMVTKPRNNLTCKTSLFEDWYACVGIKGNIAD
jgi:hypothetical protein